VDARFATSLRKLPSLGALAARSGSACGEAGEAAAAPDRGGGSQATRVARPRRAPNRPLARLAEPVQAIATALVAERLPVWATLQANLRRSPADAERLAAAGVAIRLCKGAYVESADVALPYGAPTDAALRALAAALHAAGARFALATHDPAMLDAAPGADVEMLRGVREADARALARAGRAVRIYVPYGDEWFRYTMRRLAEARGHG
jgi:hypothetical protein